MPTEQKLKNVIKVYRENIELEEKVKGLTIKIEQNHKRIIEHFFPYLLSIYKEWRPALEEKAVVIDFESNYCVEVTIKKISGYMVRAQEDQRDVYHRFELNPVLEEYEVPVFVIPKSSFDEIKTFFAFKFLE
jgi:hypothetical protein